MNLLFLLCLPPIIYIILMIVKKKENSYKTLLMIPCFIILNVFILLIYLKHHDNSIFILANAVNISIVIFTIYILKTLSEKDK